MHLRDNYPRDKLKIPHTNKVLHRTEEVITTVQAAGAEDVDKAVKSARAALKDPSWKELSASDRGRLMSRLADLIEEKRETFATIDAWDNGEKYA